MMTTNIDQYKRSFEEYVEVFEEEVDHNLRLIRQQYVRNFINRLNQRQKEWEETFQELLAKSQEEDIANIKNRSQLSTTSAVTSSPLNFTLTPQENLLQPLATSANTVTTSTKLDISIEKTLTEPSKSIQEKQNDSVTSKVSIKIDQERQVNEKQDDNGFCNPLFSNFNSVSEFVRLQELLQQTRTSLNDFIASGDPEIKTYRNRLSQFIKQHVNSITVDTQQLDTKMKLFTRLFSGQQVEFQDAIIDVNKHPKAQLFSMHFAAQTFVTGGTKIPEIAKSIATVITGIVSNNLPIFKDFVVGHLQEHCPYLIPMYPRLEDFDKPTNYKIACGYCIDPKKQVIESEEKYTARMRSMALMYSCILTQSQLAGAWTWLASFLSLKPQPIISATILQAFLQEASKKMSSTYGHQYKKILTFIREEYVKNIDQVTSKTTDRQSFVKLKNLLSDDKNLISAPSVSSIFGSIRC